MFRHHTSINNQTKKYRKNTQINLKNNPQCTQRIVLTSGKWNKVAVYTISFNDNRSSI